MSNVHDYYYVSKCRSVAKNINRTESAEHKAKQTNKTAKNPNKIVRPNNCLTCANRHNFVTLPPTMKKICLTKSGFEYINRIDKT